MNAIDVRGKVRWTVAAGTAVLVMAAFLLLFRLPPSVLPATGVTPPPRETQKIEMAKSAASGSVLKQETEIRDLRPLFLPTEFNAALPEPRREAARTFLDKQTLQLGFAEGELSVAQSLPPVVTLNGKPAQEAQAADMLAEGTKPALEGFGRKPAVVEALAPRGGFIEVVASATGHRVLADTLPTDARPPGGKAWEPLEFLATVDAAGLAAPLVVTVSSRDEQVDAHYRNYLARRYRIGDRLPPGFYRIVVGP